MLHKYANEDVSLGSWFIGLDVEHIDDRRLCCGTPPGNDIQWHMFDFLVHYVYKKINKKTQILPTVAVSVSCKYVFRNIKRNQGL